VTDTTQGQDATAPANAPADEPKAAPDVDDLFPKQDVDQLFPSNYAPTSQPVRNVSPIQDMLFSDPGRSHARVLDAFGYGFKQAWGSVQQESSDADEALKKAGIYNDYAKGQHSIIKAANEAVMRPAVAALLAGKGLLSGAFAGGQAAIAQEGEELGAPNVGRELAALPEAFPAGLHQAMGIPHVPEAAPHLTEPERVAQQERNWNVAVPPTDPVQQTMDLIARAKALDVIGAGEDGYFGTKPKVAETPEAQAAAAKAAGVSAKDWNETILGQKPSEQVPSPVVAPAPIAEAGAAPEAASGEPAAVAPAAAPEASAPAADLPSRPVSPEIVADVKKDFIAAGRPPEEAEAIAELTAHFYETRAARFEGNKGTAEEMYEETAPDIRGIGVRYPATHESGAGPGASGPETIRFYHGEKGEAPTSGGPRWFSPQEDYARNYGRAGDEPENTVHYVDVPKDQAIAHGGYDEINGRPQNFEAPEEIAKRSQPLARGPGVPSGGEVPNPVNGAGPVENAGVPRPQRTIGEQRAFPHPDAQVPVETPEARAERLRIDAEDAAAATTRNVTGGPRGRAAADPQTWTLFEYLASKGGLKPDPELEAIFGNRKGPMIGGFGPLLRRDGMPLDEALRSAKDGHYMFDNADVTGGEGTLTPNDLLDKIDEQSRGQKVYRIDQAPPERHVTREEEAQHITGALREQLETSSGQKGIEIPPELEARVVEIIQKEGEHDVLAAYERAIMEDEERYEAVHQARRQSENPADRTIPGWDVPDERGPASRGGAAAAAGRGTAERPEPTGGAEPGEPARDAGAGDREAEFAQSDGKSDLGPDGKPQSVIPGTEHITDAELAQRRADETLKPKAAQKPMDTGLFGDSMDQKELFQTKRGSIRIRQDAANTINIFKRAANASTPIHELGHDWLDRLMKDAKDALAPESLKADAQIILKWFGIEKSEDIKTGHHEQFARATEQYLMEGKAPSPALAGVFAKFKRWLTEIYGTVEKLKVPMNDEVRGVFDRMLAKTPEKVPETTFADLHEADAEHTSPEQAHPMAETISSERDRIAANHLPEAQDARLEDVAGKDARLSPGGPQPDDHGHEAGMVAGKEAHPAPDGTLGAGGTETSPEGDRAREEPTDPNQNFLRVETPLTDKAGNIRLENVNSPEDVKQVLRESANRNNGFLAERRNVISDSETLALAQALGEDPAWLDRKAIGSAYNREEIIALEGMLIKSATAVRDAAASGDVLAYAEAQARLLMIHDTVQAKGSAARAEAGRALGAYNQLKKMKGSQEARDLATQLKEAGNNKTLFQMEREMRMTANMRTPEQVTRFMKSSLKETFHNAILEYYINALISGPITHMRYSVGNAVNALWTPLVEIPTAVAIGAVKQLAGYEGERVHLGEAGAQLYGLMKGSRDGLGAAIEAWNTGVSPALPEERVSAHFAQPNRAIPGGVGEAINIPSKSVAAIHSFFKSLRYEQNIQGLAYRTAANERLTGDAFNQRIADLTRSPTEEMMQSATKDALKELFMAPTDYHSAMGSLTRAINSNLAAKIIIPFMKIGSQITRNAFIERTPLGILDKQVRGNLVEGGIAQDLQAAKITAGVALIGSSVLMAAEGMMTGDGPEDPAQRAIWLLNHRPNSVQVGDITIPYQGLGHLGMLMRFSADMYETAHGWDGESGTKLAVSFFQGLTKSVLDENFMRGLKDMLDAVYHPQEYGSNYIKGFVTNWLPFSVGLSQVAHEIDPYQREAHSIFQAAQAKIPWLSEQLMPKRDRFGEPIPNGAPLPQYQNDPVVQAMEALHIGVGKLKRTIRGVELSDQQFDDYSRLAGRTTKMRLNALINTPGFAVGLTNEMKIKKIHEIITDSRESAQGMMMQQVFPQIISRALAAKTAPLNKGALAPR